MKQSGRREAAGGRRVPALSAWSLLFLWLAALAVLSGQTGAPQKPAPPGSAAGPATAGTPSPARPQTAASTPAAVPDLTRQPTLFVVGYAHLDTEWRWDYKQTIQEYLPKTIRENFALLEKYPHYIFNFSGARRYAMMKEYYPADYAKVKKLVAAGRWFPAGSSVEENDVNSPSAESIIRQILYGKQFFRREFGKTSAEYMLPDCFGFPASLPSLLAHAGIKAFSTQKLSSSWQPAAKVGGPDSPERTPVGIPFNVGVWEGPDGQSVIAALNPGSYSGSVTYDLSKTPPPPVTDPSQPQRAPRALIDWPGRIDINGRLTGIYADYMYYGTGDTGGSPNESSVKFMEALAAKGRTPIPPLPPSGGGRGGQATGPAPDWPGPDVQVGDGPVRVVSATADQLFTLLKPDQTARMPRYKGDLELINHSAGSITSQAYMKRWNRQNEVLADAAERAAVVASWLGARYPLERLNDAWTLVLGGQFHDIIPGTSIPKAYEYAWNDEVLALNQFAGVLTNATEEVAAALNTRTTGTPVVVFNSLNVHREDPVEAAFSFPGGPPKGVRVIGPGGDEVPSQLTYDGKVLFLASLPSVAFGVFDVQAAAATGAAPLGEVTESSLENARYRLKLDTNGDIASIFDKTLSKELLTAPARLEIKTDKPRDWPAWNMDWADQQRAPRAYVQGPARTRILERGPVRLALEVAREAEGSRFVQTIRLYKGDAGNRIEILNAVDWKTKEAHVKAVFPLAAANRLATYNWDVGTIDRTTNEERQFEVASHQWIDLTNEDKAFGVTILTDCKNASDKPADNTLRLTLIRTPGIGEGNGAAYADQTTQDWGHHEFVYGLAAHAGDWRDAQSYWQALRLNQPLVAFETTRHDAPLGRTLSLVALNTSRARVLALKKAEQSDEIIVRLVELDGRKAQDVRLTFAGRVMAAREVNGAEEAIGPAKVDGGVLVTTLGPYQPRTFAVKLSPPPTRVRSVRAQALPLPFDQAVASPDGSVGAGRFDAVGRSLPAELLPAEIAFGAVRFRLGPSDRLNALTPRGQKLSLPPGPVSRLYILAAADGDQRATFRVGDTPFDLIIQSWGGYIGQWDNRLWTTREEPLAQAAPAATRSTTVTPMPSITPASAAEMRPGATPPPRMRTITEFRDLAPGYVKRAPVAWFASHRHDTDGTNDAYAYSYLFVYVLDVPAGATTLTFPFNERIRVLAVTVSDEDAPVKAAAVLYE